MFRPHRVLLLALAALVVCWLPDASGASAQDFDGRLNQAREHLRQAIDQATSGLADRTREQLDGLSLEAGPTGPVAPAPQAQPQPQPQPVQPAPAAGDGAWIGIIARAASSDELEASHIEAGLLVVRVVSRGPASKGGLKGNDILVRFAGKELATRQDLRDVLRTLKVGTKVTVVFRRNGIEMRTEVTPTEKPEPAPDLTGRPANQGGWLGIVHSSTSDGLMVMSTLEESPAEVAGLKAGDIIIAVDGQPIATSTDLQAAFAARKIGDTMTFAIRRGRTQEAIELTITQRPAIEYDLTPPRRDDLQLPELPGPDGRLSPEMARRINELNNQGVDLLRQQKHDEAIQYFEKMLELVPDDQTALYNLACSYSLLGQLEKAVDYFERSLYAGFDDWNHIAGDTDLDNIREHPKYVELESKKDHFARVMAEKQLEQIKGFLGENNINATEYVYKIDEEHRFVFAARYSEDVLRVVAADLMEYAEAQWEHLFIRRPLSYITILLTGEEDFRKLVPNRMIGGFYNPRTRTLLMPSLDSTLVHEFTHALHFADTSQIRQGHSIWFVEGLATCFEYSRLREDERADGTKTHVPELLANNRLQYLQEKLSVGAAWPLETLMRMSQQEFMNGDPGLGYAQSCFVCRYIHSQGKLKDYYSAYCDLFERDNSGILALQQVLGKSLKDIEADFFAWVKALPPYAGATGKGGAFLGVNFEEAEDGVRLTQVIAGGPAELSGLKVGDVIMEMAGIRVVSQAKVLSILGNCKPGDRLLFKIKRDGSTEWQDLDVVLGKRE